MVSGRAFTLVARASDCRMSVLIASGTVSGVSQFVDRVASVRPQHSRYLRDDRVLGRIALHGQHRLANDDVAAGVRQSGGCRVGDPDARVRAAEFGEHAANHIGRVGVAFGADVRPRAPGEDLGGGAAQSRRQFKHVGVVQLGAGQHCAGEFDAARAKHAFTQPR